MGIGEGIMLILRIALETGGAAKLREFFTRHKDELLQMRASIKETRKPKGY